jgi:hypothetical protein
MGYRDFQKGETFVLSNPMKLSVFPTSIPLQP